MSGAIRYRFTLLLLLDSSVRKVECLTAVAVTLHAMSQEDGFPQPSDKLVYAAGNFCNCYAMLRDINPKCYAKADDAAGTHIPFAEILRGGDDACPQLDLGCAQVASFESDCVGPDVSGVDAMESVCEAYGSELRALGDPNGANTQVPSLEEDPELPCASEVRERESALFFPIA